MRICSILVRKEIAIKLFSSRTVTAKLNSELRYSGAGALWLRICFAFVFKGLSRYYSHQAAEVFSIGSNNV